MFGFCFDHSFLANALIKLFFDRFQFFNRHPTWPPVASNRVDYYYFCALSVLWGILSFFSSFQSNLITLQASCAIDRSLFIRIMINGRKFQAWSFSMRNQNNFEDWNLRYLMFVYQTYHTDRRSLQKMQYNVVDPKYSY